MRSGCRAVNGLEIAARQDNQLGGRQPNNGSRLALVAEHRLLGAYPVERLSVIVLCLQTVGTCGSNGCGVLCACKSNN